MEPDECSHDDESQQVYGKEGEHESPTTLFRTKTHQTCRYRFPLGEPVEDPPDQGTHHLESVLIPNHPVTGDTRYKSQTCHQYPGHPSQPVGTTKSIREEGTQSVDDDGNDKDIRSVTVDSAKESCPDEDIHTGYTVVRNVESKIVEECHIEAGHAYDDEQKDGDGACRV